MMLGCQDETLNENYANILLLFLIKYVQNKSYLVGTC